MNSENIKKLAKLVRYYILASSTQAGSGHPTSSLSAADLMVGLLFGGSASPADRLFHFDFKNPLNINNDRFLFSKGHATPLYYSLFLAAGQITADEIMKMRKFDSPLEGHPTPRFRFLEASTGSLGQGLSIGVGLALGIKSHMQANAQSSNLARVYVLLGDGEMAEGSVWEAMNLASYYKLSNLTAIVDVNRLGQSQETSLGWDTQTYKNRFEAFGWKTIVIDGHDYDKINEAYREIVEEKKQPTAIIAKTIKGKGVSFIENKDGWHGKPLKKEELDLALKELDETDLNIRGDVAKPVLTATPIASPKSPKYPKIEYKLGEEVATRKAYGNALARIGESYPNLVSLDGDVKNSTYAEVFKARYEARFFEMFIAEQNMVGAGVGFARLGFIPFVSSFACFLTRGFDQIRMASISQANVKFCGSHAGVSIGEDGPSQMALEDLAMFRAVKDSVVLYPSDAVSTEKLVEEMVKHTGISYLRTSRPTTQVIYENNEEFKIGGSKIHRIKYQVSSIKYKKIIIIGAGVTLYEALKAQAKLVKEGIEAIVVDLYSIKPIDAATLINLTKESENIITVEDHYAEGGLGDAILDVFAADSKVKITKLAVRKTPRSGKPAELLAYEEIDAAAIVKKVKDIVY